MNVIHFQAVLDSYLLKNCQKSTINTFMLVSNKHYSLSVLWTITSTNEVMFWVYLFVCPLVSLTVSVFAITPETNNRICMNFSMRVGPHRRKI